MACLSHPLLSLWQSWYGSIRNKTSELKCPVVCNRQKFHALLLNLLNGLGFFWVAGCSTFFLPGFQGCTRGEQESASQSVQLQHMETTAVFHEGHEWGMKKNLICVTRVSERKENETISAGASEGGPHKKQVSLYLLFPLDGGKAYLYIPLLMYVMQMSFLNKNFCSLYS